MAPTLPPLVGPDLPRSRRAFRGPLCPVVCRRRQRLRTPTGVRCVPSPLVAFALGGVRSAGGAGGALARLGVLTVFPGLRRTS